MVGGDAMTRLSRNEIYALVFRAARGAKVPLSQGREFSGVLRSLGDDDLAKIWADALAGLESPRADPHGAKVENCWMISGADPLQSIPAALDFAEAGEVVRHSTSLVLEYWAAYRGFVASNDGTLIRRSKSTPAQGPVNVDSDIYNRLSILSARTYVPSTAENRAGAGAGDIDNE